MKISLPKGLFKERIHIPTASEGRKVEATKDYILYYMQTSFRTKYNYSLHYAIHQANQLQKPLKVLCTIEQETKTNEDMAFRHSINPRHMKFYLEGLQSVVNELKQLQIGCWIAHCTKEFTAPNVLIQACSKACMLVLDHPYQRYQLNANDRLVQSISCLAVQVEGDVVVPVRAASDKEEYAARTIRPKIQRQLHKYITSLSLLELADSKLAKKALTIPPATMGGFEWTELSSDDKYIEKIVKSIDFKDKDAFPVDAYRGGSVAGQKILDEFLQHRLLKYDEDRNDPSGNGCSNLSPYIRFGHLSVVDIALQVNAKELGSGNRKGKVDFLEEMIVRRELAVNFVFYNPNYDQFECLPNFAKITLADHLHDKREYVYSYKELEMGQTHDPYWNSAQLEMVATGKMSNYMRMYWGKKIIEWTNDPETAFNYALELNNKWELDGPDPNSFAGVAWVFGKHDQGWRERAIFGKVRYMNAAGLERKFKIKDYVRKVKKICAASDDMAQFLGERNKKRKRTALEEYLKST